jgi:membrane-associated phospholipid phosphatase
MLEIFVIDNHWILNVRNDTLTSIFVLFPTIFSLYFYISVFALGYWVNPQKILFISLGFLLPFSTLLNCLLKSTFQIPRPDQSLHLIPTLDPFGFPSGDVQIATVFWLSLFFSVALSRLRYFYILPIIAIAISRVYLGIHSVIDVTSGFQVGFLTLFLWRKMFSPNTVFLTQKKATIYFWVTFTSMVCLYSLASINIEWPKMAPMAIGTLLGFGLSLPSILEKLNRPNQDNSMRNPWRLMLYLSMIILMAKLIPQSSVNTTVLNATIILKYCVITLCIFVFIPLLNLKITRSRTKIFGAPSFS